MQSKNLNAIFRQVLMGYHLYFLDVKDDIAFPLALMFKQMLSVDFIPDEWKSAVITPVHKKEPTEQVSNYRPISITCVPCKLLERISANQIYRHLNENNILCNEQHVPISLKL